MNIFELYKTEWLYNSLFPVAGVSLNNKVVDSVQWLFEVSVFIGFIYLLFRIVDAIDKKKVLWHLLTRYLFFWFCIVWIAGFIIYCWGMYVEGASVFSFAPQAVLQAFGMFLSQSDISLVQTDRHESAFYMTFFSLSHFCAVTLSLVFVIKHFGNYFRFMAKRWSATSPWGTKRENLYVFWGKCQGSILLAEDILAKKELMKNARVVLVHTSDDTQGEVARMGINQLVSMMTLKDEDLEQLQSDGGLVYKSYKRLSKLDLTKYKMPDNATEQGVSVLEDMLDQRSLIKLIKQKKNSGTVRFFMLTEDFKSNVDAIKNLLYDSDLRKIQKKVEVYCLASPSEVDDLQYSFDNMTLQDNKLWVHVIDASMLAISQLKRGEPTDRGIYHPVRYMDVDKDKVCATSSFNGMVLGFGDTGREALSFMYEFSAIPDCNGEKMKTQILVFDKAMGEKSGAFYEQHPAFFGDESEIRLIKADVQSEDFLRELSKQIRSLDYVIICTGNDDINLKTATRLYNYAYQHREGIDSKLGIFVCCTRKENCQRMMDMESHYNAIGIDKKIEMHIFGSPRDIYKYRLIVSNTILEEAMRFNMKYTQTRLALEQEGLAGEKLQANMKELSEVNNRTPAEQWKKDFTLQNNQWEERFKKMSNIKQNYSNSLHIDTKLWLLHLVRSDADIEKLRNWYSLARQHTQKTRYPDRQEAFTQLATCEHLRWEASMKMLGYVSTSEIKKKNYRTKEHWCIKPLKEIDASTQMYDYVTVDTSFEIASENSKEI